MSHGLGGERKKVIAPLPVDLGIAGQLDIGFVNQGSGLERVAGTFAAQERGGEAFELESWGELILGVPPPDDARFRRAVIYRIPIGGAYSELIIGREGAVGCEVWSGHSEDAESGVQGCRKV
jgi:hypothetical protein